MKLGSALKYARGDDQVISLYSEYVRGKRDVAAERDALVEIMTRPERVRTDSFSASSAGSCLRHRQFEHAGLKKPELDFRTANIFANGDFFHLRVQVAGLIGGWLLQAEESVEIPHLKMKGTMDGRLEWGSILEAKSINSNGFRSVSSFGAKKDHVYQVHAYMLASGMRQANIVYENKDTQEMKEFVVHADDEVLMAVSREFQELYDSTEAKVLLPMQPDCVKKEGSEYRWCPFAAQCSGMTNEVLGGSRPPRTFSIQKS